MEKIVAETLIKIKVHLAQGVKFAKKMQKSPLVQLLKLNQPVALTLVLWPTLWGFFGTQETNWWHLVSLVLLAGLMAVFALVYLDEATAETVGEESAMATSLNRQLALCAVGGFGLWLAFTMGVAPFLLLCVWGLAVAAYPMVMKLTWWPQFYAAGLFGFLPVLLGQSGSGGIQLETMPLAVAAFLWALGVEALRADSEKLKALKKGLKSVALWLGDRNISFVVLAMAASLAMFVFAGLAQGLGGLFYAGLMAAQTTLVVAYVQKGGKTAAAETMPLVALAGLFVALGLLFS